MKQPKFSRETWENVNWELPARVIASHLGCGVGLVYSWAKKMGKELPEQRRGPESEIDWEEVDFTKTIAELAEELGMSTVWIGKMRVRELARREKEEKQCPA